MGGTFDPIHNGHLNIAICAAIQLGATGLGFVPCHITPHKNQPSTNAVSRVAMIKLCLESKKFTEEFKKTNLRWLTLEDYELSFSRPSYTLHTLEYLRNKLGPSTPIYWLLGMDSINSLNTWHHWDRLLDFAHIVAINRPGHPINLATQLQSWWSEHYSKIESLGGRASGKCISLNCSEIDISSSKIRHLIAGNFPITKMVPKCVEQYIIENKLYLIEEQNPT